MIYVIYKIWDVFKRGDSFTVKEIVGYTSILADALDLVAVGNSKKETERVTADYYTADVRLYSLEECKRLFKGDFSTSGTETGRYQCQSPNS